MRRFLDKGKLGSNEAGGKNVETEKLSGKIEARGYMKDEFFCVFSLELFSFKQGNLVFSARKTTYNLIRNY